MSKLKEYLDSKPLIYKDIDYKRMPKIWQEIKENFHLPKIIHIIGTNGKGSTGRFLAYYLYKTGKKTGHYSSPHILKFNERIWIDGKDIDDENLESAHLKLQKILSKEQSNKLSYFEYTTLLAMVCFRECEFVILEAGLGGEYDATTVFENELTLVTTIGIDHQSFLGDDIKQIATTKLNGVQKAMILGYQNFKEVEIVAKEIAQKKGVKLFKYEEFEEALKLTQKLNLPKVFSHNISLAMSGVKYLGYEVDFELLTDIKLFGRAQKIAPNITIDVGHNPLAAMSLYEHFKGKKIDLIYNTLDDKDFREVLKILKPIINKLHIIQIDSKRVVKTDILEDVLKELNIEYDYFKSIDPKKEYLVFGSFYVVEEFLKSTRFDHQKTILPSS
ncbi:MAG: bifunctional folylpolyglutamate synthase/dihydrofolate synthase [Sulfurospirillum sp.]|nr:MAG: bifunctional folylpolyglutamate synthase/dihydrofolate synthase [Sulfurospirillum sp.]